MACKGGMGFSKRTGVGEARATKCLLSAMTGCEGKNGDIAENGGLDGAATGEYDDVMTTSRSLGLMSGSRGVVPSP